MWKNDWGSFGIRSAGVFCSPAETFGTHAIRRAVLTVARALSTLVIRPWRVAEVCDAIRVAWRVVALVFRLLAVGVLTPFGGYWI